MPRVPTYDSPTVEQNALPSVQMAAPQVKNYAIDQGIQQSEALSQAGNTAAKVAIDAAQKFNQLRVDEALNEAKAESFRLAYDKDAGFMNARGKDAIERKSGKPLADEYAETYKERISKISAGLANDAQRQAFTMRANDMANSLYGHALKHEAEQSKVWADGVDESSIKLKLGDIGANFNNPARVDVAINGLTNEKGEVVERGIKHHVQDMAKRNGKPPEWVDEKTRELVSGAHREIVLRMMDKSPTEALGYLTANIEQLGDHVTSLQRALRPAVDREQGNLKGERIFTNNTAYGSTFDSIVNKVLKIEGGYVADDAGKGETNLGINKTANPDVDIKGLTPEKAKAIYKERYWNAIGGDSLPPEIRAVAFDAAVNHGPSKANQMLADSGGDPAKFIELRRAEYARLLRENPAKYGKYEKSWDSRLNQLSASLKGERSTSAMLDEADQIEDPEQRNIATSRIKHLSQAEKMAKQEEYDANYNMAQEIAFAKPGGWSDIPPSSWAALTPKDREAMRAGLQKHSDPNTKLMLQENPDLWVKGKIEQYRPMLSESDYLNFHSRANGPQAEQKILQAKIDNEQFTDGLMRAGLDKLLHVKAGTPEEKERIDLKAKFEKAIEAEQQSKKKTLSIDEKNALLLPMLKMVKEQQVRTGLLFGMFDGLSSPVEKRVYQVKYPENIIVPKAARERAVAEFKKIGINATNEQILNHYLLSEEPK